MHLEATKMLGMFGLGEAVAGLALKWDAERPVARTGLAKTPGFLRAEVVL